MGKNMSESKCCNCCCSCGSTMLTMQTNVNYLVNNQSFTIQGNIDASMSKTEINNYKVILREIITRVAGKVRHDKRDVILYDAKKTLGRGEQDSFSTIVALPPGNGYTAVGCIISRVYYIALEAEVCCCYSNPKL